MKRLLLLLLLIATPAFAGDILIYNQDGTFKDWKDSKDEAPYISCTDCIINPDLSAVNGVPQTFWLVEDGNVRQMSDIEKDTFRLAEAITAKKNTADAASRSNIAQGFTYDGENFSLSSEAKMNWTNLVIAKDLLTYPVNINTLDNQVYSLADATAISNFYATGIGTVKAHYDAARAQKAIYEGCDTYKCIDLCEVQACVDCEDDIDPATCFEAYEPDEEI